MLIRVLVKNFLSFNEAEEFNLLPNKKRKRHEEHVYECASINLLKVAAVYGNNAAGKTNLIKAANLIKAIATNKKVEKNIYSEYVFRLVKVANNDVPISIAVEFISNDQFYYYHIDILENNVFNEELCVKKNVTDLYSKIYTTEYTQDKRGFIVYDKSGNVIENYIDDKLQSYLDKNPRASILSLQQDYPVVSNNDIEYAVKWFDDNLGIIDIEQMLRKIIPILHDDNISYEYINKILPTLSLGINNISLSTKLLSEISEDDKDGDMEKIIELLHDLPDKAAGVSKIENHKTPLLSISKENGEVVVKKLMFTHCGVGGENVEMTINNQSDGTKSAIVIICLLNKLITENSILFVDEIENSMHPMIIKNLLEIFLQNKNTKGQLIFTTHEVHLLDQELLRADEIWFAEKENGSTRLYSLNDFKEHSAIDVQKGYFAGRYGAIPYLNTKESLICNEG